MKENTSKNGLKEEEEREGRSRQMECSRSVRRARCVTCVACLCLSDCDCRRRRGGSSQSRLAHSSLRSALCGHSSRLSLCLSAFRFPLSDSSGSFCCFCFSGWSLCGCGGSTSIFITYSLYNLLSATLPSRRFIRRVHISLITIFPKWKNWASSVKWIFSWLSKQKFLSLT